MSLNKLPGDIIKLITKYIDIEDIDKKNISFYSISKEFRKYQIFLYLNILHTLKYIEDSTIFYFITIFDIILNL
jgi:hypothetical protein